MGRTNKRWPCRERLAARWRVPAHDLQIPAGTVCLWRNQSGRTQEVVPVGDGPPFKGGLLPVRATRLVLARRPATFALRLASNPAAHIEIAILA